MFNDMTYEEIYHKYIRPHKIQAFDDGYKQGKADAIDAKLQSFAQWLWDNNYLVDEAFTIKLVEQYKTEQLKNKNMADFKVALPTTTEEWQRDMNIAYNQALDDFAKKMNKMLSATDLRDNGYYIENLVSIVKNELKEDKDANRNSND